MPATAATTRFGIALPGGSSGSLTPSSLADAARQIEATGFTSAWAFDSISRGFLLADPLTALAVAGTVTRTIELGTGVLQVPLRNPVELAQRVLTTHLVSGGRLRLGVGVGWSPVEFEALGETLDNRGQRIEEQVDVMRALWTRELVTCEGRWHRVPDAGLNPLPVQRPIPLWMGGDHEAVLRRMARLADGWITLPSFRPGAAAQETIDRLHRRIREAGRDPAAFGIEARMALAQTAVENRA